MITNNIFYRSVLSTIVMLCVVGCGKNADFDIHPGDDEEEAVKSYSVSVGAHPVEFSTRAEYDGVSYKWSIADQMGFYVVPAGGNSPVVSNARFTSVNTEPVVATDFEGEISEPMLSRISATGKYDYYSYYPYRAGTGGAGDMKVAFDISETISLTPDVLSTDYGFMVAKSTMGTGDEPFSWLDADGEQMFGTNISLRYKHVMAWLGVYLKVNLMSKPIGKIVISATDGTPVWGTSAIVDLLSEVVTFTGGTGRLTVNIPAGMGVSTVAGKGYVWIPVSPALAGKQLRFEFYTTEGFRIGEDDDFVLTAGALTGGKRHRAGFQLPFFVDFSQGVSSVSGGYSAFGHTISYKNTVYYDDNGLRLEGAGSPILNTQQGDRGAIKLPMLDLTTNPGYTRKSGYVKIKIDAHGPNSFSLDSFRRLYYAAMSASDYNVSRDGVYFQLVNYNTGAEYEIYGDSGTSVQLNNSTYVTFRTHAGASYRSWIRKIWVYPNFDYVP